MGFLGSVIVCCALDLFGVSEFPEESFHWGGGEYWRICAARREMRTAVSYAVCDFIAQASLYRPEAECTDPTRNANGQGLEFMFFHSCQLSFKVVF